MMINEPKFYYSLSIHSYSNIQHSAQSNWTKNSELYNWNNKRSSLQIYLLFSNCILYSFNTKNELKDTIVYNTMYYVLCCLLLLTRSVAVLLYFYSCPYNLNLVFWSLILVLYIVHGLHLIKHRISIVATGHNNRA